MANLEFSTTLKTQEITIDGIKYFIKELDGVGYSEWQNGLGGKASLGSDGKIQMTDLNIKDQIFSLLKHTLFDENDKLVDFAIFKTWPQTVLQKLFDISQKLSGLNKKAKDEQDDEAKN